MVNSEDFIIINKKNRKILKQILPLQKPMSVFIEPTNLCNFRCVCCGHGQEKNLEDLKPLQHMDMVIYRKVINELKNWQGPKLSLLRLAVLGEPFVHPQMVQMIKIAKEANVAETVDTFSNGSLLTPDISEKLVECGLDRIRFSIYSVLPEKHKKVTQTNFDLNQIHDNIKYLREIRERKGVSKPYIFVKMFDAYGPENDLFFDMYRDIADEIGLEKVHDATRYNSTNLVGAFYDNPLTEKVTREEYSKSLHDYTACSRPFVSLVINSLGNVLMCTHDLPKGTKIGDVKNNTLAEIWNSRELFEFRKMHLLGKKHENVMCKNCDWYKLFPEEDNVDGVPIEKLIPKGAIWK